MDPQFTSFTDLHVNNISLYAVGKSLSQVSNDIDNQPRATIPCIGADEFTVLANDAKVRALYTLGSLPKTAGAPHIVKAIVKNIGSTPLTNINVTLNITGSNSFTNTKTIVSQLVGGQDTISFDPFSPTAIGLNDVKVSIPTDADTTNNQLSYFQNVTDTVFGYADTSKPVAYVGFGTASGKMYTKYFVNGTKILHSISAYISKDNTIGKQLYAIVLNSNGVAVDSSAIRTITASDTNTWVQFNVLNPPSTSTANSYFYAGIAQIANASTFNPIGSQIENPTRPGAYYSSAINGSGLIQRTNLGRLMINANFGDPTNKDASMINVLSPVSGCGLTAIEVVNVVIQNKGLDTIFGGQNVLMAKYGFKVNGNIINVVTKQITDTIFPAATKNVSFSVPVNVFAPTVDSTYHLVAWVELTNDPFASNDSINLDILSKFTPLAPMANNVSIPYGNAAILTAISNDTIFWYHQAIGGTKLAQGNTYTTPLLFANDTLYANAVTKFSAIATLGTGTSTNGTSSYPAPYGNYWWGQKYQILITKAELNAYGSYGGNIKSLAFDVAVTGGAPLQNFEIKMGHTSSSALATGSYATNLTSVYTNALYTDVVGWNTHVFTTPFIWNGVDNIIVETCFNNSAYTTNAQMRYSTTAFNSVAYSYGDNAANCTNGTSTYAIANRPNMKLSIEKDGCESPRTKVVVTVAPPPANEVAMLAFTSPTGPVPANTTTPIKVKVKNSGLLPLTSVKVNFIVNSVLQPQFPWTNTSTPLQHDSTMELTVGSFNLPGGLDTIIAWTSDPNNVTDPYPLNDTAKIYFSTCMSGNYTIGVGKNFPTFTAALNAATMAGVCGNTVFLADSGLYEERLFLNPIPGAGPNARVSFTSASGDSTKVVLHYTLSSAAAWAMKFIGSSYITFSKMTLSVSGSNTWGRIMELGPNANHIEISNCVLEGMQGGTTSNYTLIYMSGAGINYNTIKNNLILNGYQVLYLYGVSGNTNIKNTISNNNIKDFTYYAIYAAYQDSISIIGNNIQNIAGASYAYGLYSYYCNNFSYLKNKININATYNYGMYLYYNNNTYGSGLVANNFVSQSVGTSTTYGIYAYYSNNVNYYYNSINITGAYTSNYAFYIYGATAANNNIVNNIFSNTGGGYAYYASSTTGVNISNYNDLYATGTNLGYWGGAATSLAAFKSLSGKDANSISVNPGFFSLTNLHMVNFMIDKMGTPIAGVTDDIDGDVRNATLPDMGADEFNLPDNDAGITAMTLPVNPTTTGVQDVKVLLKDWGVLNLTTVTIQWSVNGVMQLPKLWTGNKLSGEVDTVLLGTYNFTAGQSAMKFWTSMPNNVADQLNINDTLLTSVLVCNGALSGSYTLGGSSANYATFNGALQALQMCGIAGPVTFNVAPGFYNEQFVIGNLTGVSASNTVTFKSANGDSTSVVLGFNFTQTNNNYVIQFGAGAQYITIKGMTIRQTNTASGRVINFTGSPSNITIANNRIEMPFNSAGTTAGVVTLSSDFGNDNKILNNNISTGYNGIVAQGSAATPALRTLIKGNIITGFYNYGIQCTYLNSPIIDSNTVVSTVSGSGTRVGIYMSSVTDSMKVSKNTIVLSNSTNTYGIQLETVTGTPISKGLLANNFVSILNGTTYTYALRLYPAINYVVIANNSIYVNGTSTTDTRGINVVAGSNIEVYNNNVVSKYFPTLYEGNLTPILGSNYNNFYSLSSTYAYFNNVSTLTYNSLAALNAVIHMDTNSVSVDPDFISTTNLHVYTSAVNNLAKPLPYVTDDIDGHPRNATTPDIGADEFSPLPVDLAVTAFIEPSNFYAQAGATIPIKVKIKNYGADSVANFNVVCKIGNATPIVQLYTNYFHSNQLDSVLFTSITVPSGAFEIKVYTSDANDGNHLNDTLKMNYFGVPIKNIPYAENFDNTVQEWFSPESTSLWEHGIPIASVINTAHSAPNVWATKLNGNYTNSNISTLYSPIFNIAVFRADTLKFWHWVDAEINKDGGHIEYLDNMGNWDVLGHITPADTNAANWYNGSILNMWTGYSAGWYESKYKVSNLTNLGSTVQFRFVFASDATNSSYNGWAIDDFALTLAPIPADAGVIAITSPAATSLVGDLVTVSVTVKNFGTDTLTNIPVKYQVGSLAVVSGILAGPLAPLATSNYTFSQQVQVANINYTICAFTTVVGDIYTQNDISCKNIIVNPAPNDVAVTEILQPGANVSGSTTLIKVVIKNFGTLTQTSIPVTYQRGALTPVNAIWTGSLAFGDTVQFTFPSPMNIPSGVSFSLCGFTKLVNDAYIHNDSSCKSVVICTVAQAGIISGPTSVGSGATGVAYSVPTILNATTYVWTYTPSTGVVIHGNGTSSITIDFGVGSLNGVLSVYGQSSVCSGSPSSINIATNVGINDIDGSNFWLGQNTPNPTTGLTNIEYNLPLAGEVKFDIVNLYGQKVYTSDEKVEAGTHRIDLNVNDLAAGVYYYTIEFKGKRLVKKMVVNK
ncbi:MAG: T9SS type A sorting domain-containing protein [Bacteroidales bacterium]